MKDINELEVIEDVYIVIKLLKEKKILFLTNKTFFIMKNNKIRVFNTNVSYALKIDEFIDLYKNQKFYVYEENDETYDFLRDDEYYSWKHK